jgi:choline kinase
MFESTQRDSSLNAVILAAGVGSRLRPLTDSTPKCLVEVAGKPILGWQLDALHAAGLKQVTVVAGYRAQDVVAFCRQYGGRVRVIVNAIYERTNNMVSLRMALQDAEEQPTIICNGDVVFDPSIAAALVQASHPNLIAVEPGRYIEESMKVCVDHDGRITNISKAIRRQQAYGVSIDLYRFSGHGVATICRIADRMIKEERQANLWTEVAIDAALAELDVRPQSIGGAGWIEVDNMDDLAEGARIFAPVRR